MSPWVCPFKWHTHRHMHQHDLHGSWKWPLDFDSECRKTVLRKTVQWQQQNFSLSIQVYISSPLSSHLLGLHFVCMWHQHDRSWMKLDPSHTVWGHSGHFVKWGRTFLITCLKHLFWEALWKSMVVTIFSAPTHNNGGYFSTFLIFISFYVVHISETLLSFHYVLPKSDSILLLFAPALYWLTP